MSELRTRLLFCCLLAITNSLRGETALEDPSRLIKTRSCEEARVLLDRAIPTDSRNAEAWYRMGSLKKATHNPQNALECASKAIQRYRQCARLGVTEGNPRVVSESKKRPKSLGVTE